MLKTDASTETELGYYLCIKRRRNGDILKVIIEKVSAHALKRRIHTAVTQLDTVVFSPSSSKMRHKPSNLPNWH